MRELPIAFAVLILSVHFCLVTCRCGTTYFSAVNSRRTVSTTGLSGKANCEWTINPTRSLRNDEYLEIKWIALTALSFMPKCDGDFVEVFVTNQYYSIGKFCSGGLHGLPFRISSPDGYARIKFSLSVSMGAHLELQYRIKPARHYLPCENDFISSSSYHGVVSSAGWPVRATSTRCSYRIQTKKDMVTKIVIMDFDLRTPKFRCHSRADYVEMIAWNSTQWGRNRVYITKRLCGARNPFSLETKYSNIQIDVNINPWRSFRRGFKAGILKYSVKVPDSSFPLTAVTVGGIAGAAVVILIIVALICCIIKLRKRGSERARSAGSTAETPMMPAGQSGVPQDTQPGKFTGNPPPYEWKEAPAVVYCPPHADPPPPYAAVAFTPGASIPPNPYGTGS